MAAIVDRLRNIAEKVGARTTGATVQDVISDIEAKLNEGSLKPTFQKNKATKQDKPEKAEKPFFSDET